MLASASVLGTSTSMLLSTAVHSSVPLSEANDVEAVSVKAARALSSSYCIFSSLLHRRETETGASGRARLGRRQGAEERTEGTALLGQSARVSSVAGRARLTSARGGVRERIVNAEEQRPHLGGEPGMS